MTIYDYLNDKTPEVKTQRERFDQEYEKVAKAFSHSIYRFRDLVIFHILVPSTTADRVNYDVILQISTSTQHEGYGRIDRCDLHVFSNCPSFIYRLAYSFASRRLIPEFLISKYDYETLVNLPVSKKSINDLEKSLYFAVKYVYTNGLDENSVYKTAGKTVNFLAQIAEHVRTQKEILNQTRERLEEQRVLRKQQKEEAPEEESKTKKLRVSIKDNTVKATGKTKRTGQTRINVKVKSSSTSKRTKRV